MKRKNEASNPWIFSTGTSSINPLIAAKITANAPLAVRAVKRLVRQGMDMPLAHAIDVERYAFGVLYNSEDRIEGRQAFAEKRKPIYKGK